MNIYFEKHLPTAPYELTDGFIYPINGNFCIIPDMTA